MKRWEFCIVFVSAVAFASATFASAGFKSGGVSLGLTAGNGAVEFLRGTDGTDRIVPAAEAFTLQLLDSRGEPTRLKSSDFAFEGFSRAEHAERVGVWRHTNGLIVRMEVTAANDEFRFKPSVSGIPGGMLLEWFDGPQVCIPDDRMLYWPYYDECEVMQFRNRNYRPVGHRDRFGGPIGSLYPHVCHMQFLAAYKNGAGVYFSAVDARHTPKGVEWERVDDKTIRLSLQTLCGDLTGGDWRPDFHYVLRPYEGDWMEACAIYRDWVRTLPGFEHPPKRPKWMYDSPVNLIYPVRGEGLDNKPRDMEPNCYYPYVNALPTVEKYGKLLDSRIMALLMHWEGTAPWAPPYVWPPYGGEKALAEFRDALHARGDLLGVYCSGTAWTQISSIVPSYTQEQRFEDERLGCHMMRGPRGEITARICNGHDSQRLGYDMCLADGWSLRVIDDEVAKMARFGIDYCQFFDQNLGGGWLLCYAKHHGHPPIPGAWATDAMLSLQKRLVRHGMLLGCEAAASTPYVPQLFYNDSRFVLGTSWGGGNRRTVPGLAFVFHEWSCNFSGNMCGSGDVDPFWRWSYAFHNGDMLSLVLGPDGRLAAKWCEPWSEPFPEQDVLVSMVRRFNALRKKYPSFLLEGRMVKPFLKCVSSATKLLVDKKRQVYLPDVPDVIASFWENAKGERIGFATNWRRDPSTLKITRAGEQCETLRLAPFETIELHKQKVDLTSGKKAGIIDGDPKPRKERGHDN